MPTEDQCPAKITPECGIFAVIFEEPGHEFCAESARQIRFTVSSMPSNRKSFIVGICCIDLDKPTEPVLAHRICEQHREGVRFLSSRASCRPDPDRLFWSL